MSSEAVQDDILTDNDDEDMLVSQLNVDISNQYVIFTVGNEEYGIPILAVQEIISMPPMTRIPGIPDYIPGIINIRGDVIPLYILRNKFNLKLTETSDQSVVIILQLDEKRKVGFIVDAVSDVVSITDESMQEPPDFSGAVDVRFVDRIGQLGSRMIIILSLDNFFSEKETAVLEKAVKAEI